ncbi:MAG: GrpB family protein [Acidobacteriota bacterium]
MVSPFGHYGPQGGARARIQEKGLLHVFSDGCAEIGRLRLFRDCLRSNPADRDLSARARRDLAQRQWQLVQNYTDAKTAIIEEILARARVDGRRRPGQEVGVTPFPVTCRGTRWRAGCERAEHSA